MPLVGSIYKALAWVYPRVPAVLPIPVPVVYPYPQKGYGSDRILQSEDVMAWTPGPGVGTWTVGP